MSTLGIVFYVIGLVAFGAVCFTLGLYDGLPPFIKLGIAKGEEDDDTLELQREAPAYLSYQDLDGSVSFHMPTQLEITGQFTADAQASDEFVAFMHIAEKVGREVAEIVRPAIEVEEVGITGERAYRAAFTIYTLKDTIAPTV